MNHFEDNFEEAQNRVVVSGLPDAITVSSKDRTPVSIQFTKDADFRPAEDAILIEAILTAKLPEETIQQLLKALIVRHHDTAFSLFTQFSSFFGSDTAEPKASRKKRTKADD